MPSQIRKKVRRSRPVRRSTKNIKNPVIRRKRTKITKGPVKRPTGGRKVPARLQAMMRKMRIKKRPVSRQPR